MTNGSNHERYFARVFDHADYAVMKGGASGSGNYRGIDFPGPTDDRAQPDVFAAGDGDRFAFELKSGDPPHYFTADEVAALKWFARQFDAHALLASRFPRDGYRLFDPDDVHTTSSGSRRTKPGDDPLTVLADPRSEADDPPGHHWRAVKEHGLAKMVRDGPGGRDD
jgi:Holliday junction resolvase